MATLYEINKAIESFEFEFDEVTGEVTNGSYLDDLEMAKNEKCENIALFIKQLNADSEAIDNEIKSLQERKKQKEKKVEYLKGYLTFALDGQKFETPRCKVSYRNSTSVEISDEKAFIEWCESNYRTNLIKTEIKQKPIKSEIKRCIKDIDCPFVGLAKNTSMIIK